MTITEYVKRLYQEKGRYETAIEENNAKLSIANWILSNQVRLENSPERALRRSYHEMHHIQDPVYERLAELPYYKGRHFMELMENRKMTELVYNQILEGRHPDVPRTLYERLKKYVKHKRDQFDNIFIGKI